MILIFYDLNYIIFFDEFGWEDILLLFSFVSVFKICFILLVTVSYVFLLYLELISIILLLKESNELLFLILFTLFSLLFIVL